MNKLKSKLRSVKGKFLYFFVVFFHVLPVLQVLIFLCFILYNINCVLLIWKCLSD